MAAGNNRVNVEVGFSVDKSGLSQMQSLFQQIAFKAKEPGANLDAGLQKAASTANTLDQILEKTFNTDLGALNVTKFNQELTKSGMTLKSIKADLAGAGNQGATAYNRMAQAILGTNMQLKESSKLLDSMATTMTNTVKWGITSSIFNSITSAIQRAYSYSKQLDTSLNDIRIVTDKSADSMDRFAEKANQAAKNLGASTLDYTNASLIYYQQGLSDAEVAARAETTIKTANVTGQTGEEVSEQLTAVWNGYKVTAEETEAYVDKLAAVAATTAADLEELSVGMSKVAAAANAMGVDFDDLNAQIATIVSVTRQAPESVGTALKTIYARLGDLKVDGVDEFGVKLGEVSAQMQTMGIQILDQNGDLRDMSSVIAEVAEKWNTWTRAQQQAAAIAMAGKRQYNNLVALFENWDMYSNALETSTEALGTLQHQQDIYMESTAAKLKTLKATWQDLYGDLIDNDEINAGIEGLTNLVQVFDNFIESFDGGIKSISAFGAIITDIFNKQIINGINAAIQRQEVFKQNLQLTKLVSNTLSEGILSSNTNPTPYDAAAEANSKIQYEYAQKIYDARVGLNQEQANSLINYQKEIGFLEEQIKLDDNRIESIKNRNILEEDEINFIKEFSFNLEEINGAYDFQKEALENNLESAKNLLNIWQDFIKNDKVFVETEEERKSVLEQITNLSKSLGTEEKLAWEITKQKINTTEDVLTQEEDILETLRQIINVNQNDLKINKQKTEEARKLAGYYSNQATNQIKQSNIKQEADEMLRMATNAQNIAQNITLITTSLSTMAMAWSSVNSLIKTWNDETASFGDKITQTFITLGMTLPMVVSSFGKLNEVFGITNSLSILFSSNKAKEVALTQVSSIQQKIENRLLEKYIALKGISVEEVSASMRAKIADTAALKAESIATDQAASATWRLNTALLANPIGIVVAALVALTAATAAYVAIQRKQLEEQIEINKASIERENKIQSEIQANEELYDSYEKAKKAYEEGIGSKKDLEEATKQICDAYGIEIGVLDALVDKHNQVTAAIKRQREESLKEGKESAERESRSAEGALIAKAQTLDHEGGKSYYAPTISSYLRTEEDEAVRKIFKQTGLIESGKEGKPDIWKGIISDPNDIEAYIDLYNKLSKSIEQVEKTLDPMTYTQSEYYKGTKKWLEGMSEEIENINASKEDIKNYDIKIVGLKVDFEDVTNLEQYNEKINELEKEFIDLGYSEKEAAEMAKEYGKNISSIAEEAQISKEISKLTGISEKIISEFIDQLSEEDREILLSGKVEIDGLKTTENIKQAIEVAKNELNEEDLTVVVSLREKMASDKKLTKTQLKEAAGEESTLAKEYETELFDFDDQSQLKQLDTLNKIVNDKIILNKKYIDDIKNTTKEEQELLKIQEENWKKEESALLAKKIASEHGGGSSLFSQEDINRLKEIQEYLPEVEEEIKDLQEIIDNGLPLEELNELTYDNLISGIDGVITEAEILKNLTDDIGESWTIAADKIENFGKNFPEILDNAENYKYLQDGSVQLTEEGKKALEETLTARKANLAAVNEEYQLELQKQADIQQATADYYNQQADLLQAYLDGESDAKKTEEQMEKALADYKNQLMEITGANNEELNNLMQENGAITREAAEQDEKSIYEYWCSVGEAAEAASLAYENKSFNPPPFNGGGGSSGKGRSRSYQGQTTSGVASSLDQMSTDQIKAWISDYRKKADDAANKAADYISKKLGAGAALKAFENSADNAISGKGNGKSKGGGKDKKDKDEKKYEDEFDRYWEIKKAIDAVDKSLNKLKKDQQNYFGYQLIDSLKKQNALLDQQAANYNKLLEAQQAEAAELRNQLGTMGVMFDASGAIINYAEATAQALAAYNAAIQQYNAGLIDETTLGVAEKAYENFKKLLDRYDKLYYDEIKQTEEKLDDIRREKLANNLKAWEVEIEFKLNFKELKREWNDFLAEINEDFKKVYKDITAEMKKFSKNAKTYIGEDGSIGVTLKAIEDVKREIDKMMAGGTSDMFESVSQAQEKLKELNETLLKDAKALHDLWKAAWEAYLEGIEQVADKFDDLMDQFERINDELNFQKELIELIYGEEAYGLMDKLYKGQEKSLENQLQSLKTQADMWKERFEKTGATLENQAEWTEDQKEYYEKWVAAQEKLNDLTLDYIKLLKEDYSNTIKSILKDLETALAGGLLLKDIRDQWERISAYSDKYLDDVEKAYETQKLANKIDQSIASTSNLKNQQKLQALREKEIGYLREKEHLTQYDLDAAEARYQIALKEMALEDARNNKTSMKLVRNEQGNWSYQYMADEEDIQSKQQDLFDQYNKLYQLASDAYEENLNASIELEEEYNERLQEIAELRLTNEDEYNKKLAEIEAWYLEQRKLLAEENTLYRQDLETSAAAIILGVYQADHESIVGMTEEQKALLDELINGQVIPDYMELERLIKEEGNPAIAKSSEEMMESVRRDWSSSAQLLADLWNADDGKSVKAQVQKAYEAINKATEEYKAKVDWCAEAVGRDFGPDGITGAIDKAANATDNLKDRTEQLANDSARYLDTLKSYVNSLEDAWNSVKGAIEDAIRAIEEYIQKRAEANSYDSANPGNVGGGQNGTTPGNGGTGDGNGGTPSSPGSGGNNYKNYFVEYWPIDCEYYDDRGFKSKDPTKVRRINDLDLTTAQSKLQGLLNTGKYHGNVSHYDTGGYTGEWGNDGRLALLHQKELVLNKNDTANFLEGINTLRDMTSTNGSITNAIAKAVSNMAYTLGSLKSPTVSGGVINNNENTTDNNIFNISAEFPNASNVNDIREALMSLPNLASQYVARNKK